MQEQEIVLRQEKIRYAAFIKLCTRHPHLRNRGKTCTIAELIYLTIERHATGTDTVINIIYSSIINNGVRLK